mmetsp:Transcript_19519/g.41171  ORF Transcript_19519/g.41171 Transcript_19519/m.41171 type:complete len:352 (+) Transcript_19519:56-1111(+)
MKTASIALLLSALTTSHQSGGVANARILSRRPLPNPVVDFSELAIKWVELSERGPTISGHFMVHVQSALFDAFAAFKDGTTGAITDLDDEDDDEVRVPEGTYNGQKTAKLQLVAMADAAYNVITTLGQTLLDQKYLEIENGENATERLPLLLEEALSLRDETKDLCNLNDHLEAVAADVSAAVTNAILTKVTEDGSNFQNDYSDTTGYAVRPMFEPVPVITSPRTDYNFLDGSWVTQFNTYDAVLADLVPNNGFAQVHPLVVQDGTLTLTDTYQSLTQHGIFPPSADGGEQFPLTPHWGLVIPFSLSSSNEFREDVFGPYLENGDLNPQWVDEAREVVNLGGQQQDGNCPT